jgi:hypothetical protein
VFTFIEYFPFYVYFPGRDKIYQIGTLRTYNKCIVHLYCQPTDASQGLMFKENSCIDYEPSSHSAIFCIVEKHETNADTTFLIAMHFQHGAINRKEAMARVVIQNFKLSKI